MEFLKKLVDFIANNLLFRRLSVSPLNGKRVSKKQFLKETKFLADTGFMFSTIEDTLFGQTEVSVQENDFKYFELINQISIDGDESLSEMDREWLKDYIQQQDNRWKKQSG